MRHLREVLKRLRKHALYVSLGKCDLYTTKVELLSFVVSTAGVLIDPSQIATISK